jgi:hypothetical protein
MIRSLAQFSEILKEGVMVGKYIVPNGTVTLEVYSFVEEKLLEEELFKRKFKQLYEFLHDCLKNTIKLIETKYGALPAKLEPARTIFCLFVSKSTHHTFAMWAAGSQMGLIIPLDLLHETPGDIERMLMHECLHNCARLHHGEERATHEIEAHQNEMKNMAVISQKKTLEVLRALEGLEDVALNEFVKDRVNLFIHYFLTKFDNIIEDLGINIIVSLLNIKDYIRVDLEIVQHNIGNLSTAISYLEQNRQKMSAMELNCLEFSLLVFDMPWYVFPFLYNRDFASQTESLIRSYFSIVEKTSPEVQTRIRKIYADFLKIIKPHEPDLYGFNFNLEKLIHTEESLAAAKTLYDDIISFLKF